MGFHGVGGDYLKISADAPTQLVQYLRDHQDLFWVTTCRTAVDHMPSVR